MHGSDAIGPERGVGKAFEQAVINSVRIRLLTFGKRLSGGGNMCMEPTDFWFVTVGRTSKECQFQRRYGKWQVALRNSVGVGSVSQCNRRDREQHVSLGKDWRRHREVGEHCPNASCYTKRCDFPVNRAASGCDTAADLQMWETRLCFQRPICERWMVFATKDNPRPGTKRPTAQLAIDGQIEQREIAG